MLMKNVTTREGTETVDDTGAFARASPTYLHIISGYFDSTTKYRLLRV